MPSRVNPPSRATAGGSSTIVRSIRSRTSVRSSSSAVRLRHERRLKACERGPDARHRSERLPERDEVSRSSGSERDARKKPLEVVNRLERLTELGPIGGLKCQLFDGIEAIANALQCAEGSQQPRAQESTAHGRHRPIDLVQERTGGGAVAAHDDLQMPQRDRVDRRDIGRCLVRNRSDMSQVGLLRVTQVRDEPSGRLDRGGAPVEAEPFEAMHLELLEERSTRRFGLEDPWFGRRHGYLQAPRSRESGR